MRSAVLAVIIALLVLIAFDLLEYRWALSRMGTEPACYGRLNNKVECPLKSGSEVPKGYILNPGLDHTGNDVFPPPEYDYLFPGPIIITRKPNLAELNKICGGNRLIGACGERRGYTCQIFMLPNDQLEGFDMSFRGTLRHEIGHCNGWPGSHPDKRRDAPFWYDVPKKQIFYGEPLAEQLRNLAK